MDTSLAAALARIAELNRELGWDPEADPILRAHRYRAGDGNPENKDSLAGAAEALVAHIENIRASISEKEKSAQERIQRYQRMHDRAAADGRHEEAAEWIDTIEHYRGGLDSRMQPHREALEAKLSRLREAPETMFLPLGTVVRFTEAETYPNCMDLSDGRGKRYPVAGSIGVVTRLSRDSEFPIAVSMRRPYKDGWNDEYLPDFDRMPTYFVDPDKIEVVGAGLLPDGSASEAYGFQATHRWVEDSGRSEMIVEADGFLWRFQPINGVTECGQAFEDMSELSWLGEPIADTESSNPTP